MPDKHPIVKHKQKARPLNRTSVLIGLIFMEAVEPLVAGDTGGTNAAKRMKYGLSKGRNKPALSESTTRLDHDIDGKKL